MDEHPALGNQFGKFHYDTNHLYNLYGWPQGVLRPFVEEVQVGVDTHKW